MATPITDLKSPPADLRTAIAFAMWRESWPGHIQSELTPDWLGSLTTNMGDGFTATTDLQLDWELNRDSFLRLADVAIATITSRIG